MHRTLNADAVRRAAAAAELDELQRERRAANEAYQLIEARANASRQSPFWPFGTLTPAQIRARLAQQEAMRAGVLARWPAGTL